jgi:hypothetical protein
MKRESNEYRLSFVLVHQFYLIDGDTVCWSKWDTVILRKIAIGFITQIHKSIVIDLGYIADITCK